MRLRPTDNITGPMVHLLPHLTSITEHLLCAQHCVSYKGHEVVTKAWSLPLWSLSKRKDNTELALLALLLWRDTRSHGRTEQRDLT